MSELLHTLIARAYRRKVLGMQRSALIAYWPLTDGTATAYDMSGNGRNGAHTGVDYNQPGIGDGRRSVYLDGVNDYANIYSAGLASAFNAAEGTLLIWFKVNSSASWNDGTARLIAQLRVDANNRVLIQKAGGTANTLNFFYVAGGTTEQVNAGSVTSTGWIPVAFTWSKTGDIVRTYVNGTAGSTSGTLGTWAGSLGSTTCLLGASTTVPANPWHGWLAHCAVWSTPLTAAQIAILSTVR